MTIHSMIPGGMERVTAELAWYFSQKEDIDLHLIIYGKGRTIFYDLPEKLKVHKPSWEFDNNKRLRSTIKSFVFLRKKVNEIAPDSVLSMGERWNNFVLLALLGVRTNVYISDRCQPNKRLSLPHEILRKILYPLASAIIAQTEIAKKIYNDRGYNSNIKVIGNPIRSIPCEKTNSERENIVLSVGRLIETKHHDRLIKIFKQTDTEDWKLVIVGGDAQKQKGMKYLRDLISDYDMGDKVILTGNVSDVEKYYCRSKIFAFTSSSEGFPNVIGEAMSAGLPVITYDCVAGPSEMVEDGVNGYLIEQFNDEEFEKKLQYLMTNNDLRKK
ncbi:MAG: glycosyltransferase [Balneolaceae bacterium]|nr:glycosyltransferase [Balneolaceae bacterium]